MNSSLINKEILVTTAVLVLLATSCFVDAKVHVQVVNRLEHGLRLDVHCRSRDDDIGFHVLGVNDAIEWSFRANFLKTTLFYCDVHWNDDSRWCRFDAYKANRDKQRCRSKCRWMIAEDRLLYGYNQ
ncbi:plant self-incompatibility protein S1 family [Striga asiatica]|uniref:S-protein homolog n=1 Tax=Striga asiatica TaxID=4170 RepID=A0A5A7Q6B8_STRAF|nr:plant self-incompatibility protein S1 family [Striga asiatica]